jgi:HEAT repeat protein
MRWKLLADSRDMICVLGVFLPCMTAVGNGPTHEIDRLTHDLKNGEQHTRVHAAYALGRLGTRAAAALPVLEDALSDNDRKVAAYALFAILHITQDRDPRYIPALMEALRYPDGGVMFAAAEHLAQVGPPAVPALLGVLESNETGAAAYACLALGNMGPGARDAVRALIRTLQTHPEAGVRGAAAEALGKIGDPLAISPLHEALENGDPYVQQKAAASIVAITGRDPRRGARLRLWASVAAVLCVFVLSYLCWRVLLARRNARRASTRHVAGSDEHSEQAPIP